MPTPRHKWADAHSWLDDCVERHANDPRFLAGIINSMQAQLDSDEVQDIFQSEMSSDGYFIRLCDIEDCDEEHTHYDTGRKLYVCSEHLTEGDPL